MKLIYLGILVILVISLLSFYSLAEQQINPNANFYINITNASNFVRFNETQDNQSRSSWNETFTGPVCDRFMEMVR